VNIEFSQEEGIEVHVWRFLDS